MHGIEFVDDAELPDGHDFMLVTGENCAMIFYRRSAVTPSNLEDSWAAYRALQEYRPPPAPSGQTPASRHLAVVESRRVGLAELGHDLSDDLAAHHVARGRRTAGE